MAKVLGKLREIVGKTDATVLLIHHDRKNTNGSAKQKARGASDIIGAVDCHFSLSKQKDETLILSPGKTRSSSFEEIVMNFNEESFQFELVGIGADGVKAHRDNEIIKAISMMLGNQEMTCEEVKEALMEEQYKIGNHRLRKILNDNFSKKVLAHNRTVYFNKVSTSCAKSTFPGGKSKGREAETLENKGAEASIPAYQRIYSTGNRKTGNAGIESESFKNSEVFI